MTAEPDADGGKFPGQRALDQSRTWDPVTTRVVVARLHPPAMRFFGPDQQPTVTALLDRLLGQDSDRRIPIAELVDQRLDADETDGWRYFDMPPDGVAWRRSVEALDEEARQTRGKRFALLGLGDQRDLLEAVRTAATWHGFPAPRLWNLWMRYGCSAYFSHPAAWDEIGFGGPAYPRGYVNLGLDRREHWEHREVGASNAERWARRVERLRRRRRT